MKSSDIRAKFIKFFKDRQHAEIESSPLIPQNDPTLLFANAGMNQFKDYFTGKEKPLNKKAVSIQKCVRAGGKHNDLENVGMTARHHTFFEMLGNFSFGDYFKEEAISFAWEFLTKELKIPSEKLFVTVHHTDDDAFKIWEEKIGVPREKIFKKGDKDNFWEMGEFGPCGPCSEIFYDHGEDYETPNFKPGKNQDLLDDEMRYVEIWNLVFMQFEKTKAGTLKLPNPCVDTGAGLERLASALQGVYWNYDTDGFSSIINELEKKSDKSYSDEKYTSSMRIIADHLRSTVMLITDGVLPSNEGRGYVLRRIIRRAVRHLKKLEISGSYSSLVPVVFETLGKQYPQNQANQSLAEKTLELEETKFLETLDKGLKFFEDSLKKNLVGKELKGESIFMLYDTYGFPVDLTETILNERGLSADITGFEECMEKRKEESRKSWKGGTGIDNQVYFDLKSKCGETLFEGYEKLELKAKLLAVEKIEDEWIAVFDKTCFYGESGGQAGDIGEILLAGKKLTEVIDTQKPVENLFVHFLKDGSSLESGNEYTLVVNKNNRNLSARHHTATHLLQAALIKTLGDHIKQSGSSVSANRLRFDFTHHKGVNKDELNQVEDLIRSEINKATDVQATIMSKDDAIQKGAMALFGEKYGNNVRVLEIGDFSIEFCGGTHVSNISEIGSFSIINEEAVSSGVRRIEAIVSTVADEKNNARLKVMDKVQALLSSNESNLLEKIEILLKENKSKNKEINQLKDRLRSFEGDSLFDNAKELKPGIFFCVCEVENTSELRKMSDQFVDKFPEGIVVIYGSKKDKSSVLIRKSNKKLDFNCSDILNSSLSKFSGRGGGKPDMAQGSCDFENQTQVIEEIRNQVSSYFS